MQYDFGISKWCFEFSKRKKEVSVIDQNTNVDNYRFQDHNLFLVNTLQIKTEVSNRKETRGEALSNRWRKNREINNRSSELLEVIH